MAKRRPDLAGNSCHIHTSLWDGDRPAFVEGHGESELFRQFLAGMLALGPEITYFLAPYVNSYKRFQAGSFAPTSLVWSRDNRTAGFRVLGHGSATRIECRVGGADVNPYLAYAALLAAGLHGVERGLACPPVFSGDAYAAGDIPTVPATLHEAVDRLDRSEALRAALGGEVVDHYVHAGRWEQRCYDKAVTDWNMVRYFERREAALASAERQELLRAWRQAVGRRSAVGPLDHESDPTKLAVADPGVLELVEAHRPCPERGVGQQHTVEHPAAVHDEVVVARLLDHDDQRGEAGQVGVLEPAQRPPAVAAPLDVALQVQQREALPDGDQLRRFQVLGAAHQAERHLALADRVVLLEREQGGERRRPAAQVEMLQDHPLAPELDHRADRRPRWSDGCARR